MLLLWKNLYVTQLKHSALATCFELVVPGLLTYLYSYVRTDASKAHGKNATSTTQKLSIPDAIIRYMSSYPMRFLAVEQDISSARTHGVEWNVTHLEVWTVREGPKAFMVAMLPLVVVLLIPFPVFVHRVAVELFIGLKHMLLVNGMVTWVYWTGTFLSEFIKLLLVMTPVLALWNHNPHGGHGIFHKTSFEVQLSLVSLFCAASLGMALLAAAITPRPIVSVAFVVVINLSTLVLPVVAIMGTNVQFTYFMRYLQLLSCLFPNVAFCYALAIMFMNAKRDVFINWDNLHQMGTQDVTLHKVMHAMVASFLGSVLLCVYIDKVWPYEHDFPESPWFFLESSFWGAEMTVHSPARAIAFEQNKFIVESVSEKMKPYIVVYRISKDVGFLNQKREVLHSINLKLYAEHITVLLGRNCSGKTLILRLITGTTRPNHGNVYLSTFNVLQDGDEIRKVVGLCPQNVALYDSLTVRENLQFFAGVREMHAVRAKDEVNLALLEFQFYTIRYTRVKNLTYGQKRKLQLAISLLGMPEYLILDEPTRGVDMETRRTLWETILKMRQTRGILLVTNCTDEADILGDRIAILTSGVIAVCGSPLFLRKQHGAGYRLAISFDKAAEKSRVTHVIEDVLPNTELFVERRLCIVYSIGYPSARTLISLLQRLEDNQDDLHIRDIGIVTASLEDVLLKFDVAAGDFNLLEYKEEPTASGMQSERSRIHASEDMPIFVCQVDALVRKKLSYVMRSLNVVCMLKFVQVAFMFFMEGYFENKELWKGVEQLTLSNVNYNAIRNITGLLPNQTTLYYDYDWVTQELHSVVFSARTLATCVVPLSLSIMASFFVFLPTKERVSGAKHLQLMTGLTPERYWAISFCMDMMQHLVGSIAAVLPIVLPTYSSLNCHDYAYSGPMFCLFFMYGWAFVPLCYMVSFFMDQDMTAYSGLVLSSLLFGTAINVYMAVVAPNTVSNFRPEDTASQIAEFFIVLLRILPQFAVARGSGQVQMFFFERAACCHLPQDLLNYTCRSNASHYADFQRQFFNLVRLCCRARCDEAACSFVTSDETFSSRSCFWDIMLLFLSGLAYMGIVISWEHRPNAQAYMMSVREKVRIKRQLPIQANISHPTVLNENARAQQLVDRMKETQGKEKPHGLVAHQICIAARGTHFPPLSFCVAQGEIFGVVGLAQSGRSSVLRAVAGETRILSGELYLNGVSQSRNREAYQRQIGYCPQQNPLVDKLTVREMLLLLARLRGLNPEEVEDEVAYVLGKVGLARVGQKTAGIIPSSQKRRLSIGLALVGDPRLVIMDESTEGVDPVSRGKLMKCMDIVHANHNFSVLITSHRANECDVLCDRLAFLSDGEFMALGEAYKLKDNAGQRFSVILKPTVHQAWQKDFYKQANRQIKAVFPTSVITDMRQHQLTYRVKDVGMPWSEVFQRMEKLKTILQFEDYLVSEASLADIFLGFAHERKVVDFDGQDVIRYYSLEDPPMLMAQTPSEQRSKKNISDNTV